MFGKVRFLALNWVGALVLLSSLPAIAPAWQAGSDSNLKEATPEIKKAVLTKLNEIMASRAYVPGVDFSKWPTFFQAHQADVEKATTPREFVQAVNKALKEFGISHIVLSTPQAAQARRERKTIGIGVSLQLEEGGLRVTSLFEGAPASKAGIEIGDLILKADGKKPDNPTALAGEEGTEIELEVQKTNGIVKTYKIKREKFSTVRPETLTWVDKKTALVKIHTFDISYNRANVEKIMKEAASAKRIILDLRSNGGGAVANFIHLLGFFMPEGTPVGTFVNKSMVDRFVKETGYQPDDTLRIAHWSNQKVKAGRAPIEPFKGHVAVLINGGTGSASEIVAAALQETLGCPVVGARSAGAVLVSVMVPLPYGYQIQYPISDYVTMQGVRLEKNGVTPDVVAQAPRFGEQDAAIGKAMALLYRAELRDERFGKTAEAPK